MFTASKAAEKLDLHPRTVSRLCAQHGIGLRVSERVRILSDRDIRRLEKLKKDVGNPNFGRRKSKASKG